ncbi:hypothetical protein VNO77_04152 [Canavalia gladiata]|uniref:Uncharacterized protein n=1 Tax=Canavalia gladiata TaxID=3824 RepID=A0AAN9MWP2_CANGL
MENCDVIAVVLEIVQPGLKRVLHPLSGYARQNQPRSMALITSIWNFGRNSPSWMVQRMIFEVLVGRLQIMHQPHVTDACDVQSMNLLTWPCMSMERKSPNLSLVSKKITAIDLKFRSRISQFLHDTGRRRE